MTEEQLKKGNLLDNKIGYTKNVIRSIAKTIREASLDNTGYCIDESMQIINVAGKECTVYKDRLIEFLETEKKTQEHELKEIEKEFRSI